MIDCYVMPRGSASRRQLHAGQFDEISCSFSQSVKRVIGVEIIENAVEDAKANAQLNGELKNIPNFLSLFYWLNSDYFFVLHCRSYKRPVCLR